MINGELLVDNFAGGGGTSTGIEMATGVSVDIAINHDPEAIRMHKTNHPATEHYCENVWDVDPVKACKEHPVGLAWFSPDCKHFSKAKGGKPKDKKIRGLAWVALRWAGKVRPRVIMLENVDEFRTWGPLNRRHRPIKKKQGVTFQRFVTQLEALGYTVEYRELVAADYGTPTMRKRFFLIARCDGRPIIWPEPTHAPADSPEVAAGTKKPYVGAYTRIDFSLPCPSIFDTAEEIKEKYGIRAVRPLASKTMERIARGLKKFVLENPEPFIIQCNHGGGRKPQGIQDPMPTITGKHGYAVVEPYMVQIGQTGFAADRSKDVREPLTTVVCKNEHCLIETDLRMVGDGAGFPIERGRYPAYCNPQEMDKLPFADPETEREIQEQLSTPYIMCNNANNVGADVKDGLPTITTGNRNFLAAPTLIQYHSETSKDEVRGQGIGKPIMTVDGANRYGLVSAFVQKYYAGETRSDVSDVWQPLHTITARHGQSLCASTLIQMNNHCDGRDISEPLPTITAGDGHFGEVRAFMVKYYGKKTGQDVKESMDTVTTQDRFGLVNIQGVDYQIVDIGLRMLEPKELYGCQGFPDDYIIDRDYTWKIYPRSEQIKRCGNAVPPAFAKALVRANLPELCVAKELTKQIKFA